MTTIPTPLALVAELTHRCPLHCVYCSNPLELAKRESELSTQTWVRVLQEAAHAGVYVSLITSGLPLDEAKLTALVEAGLDHFQLSFQGANEQTAREISNTTSHPQKLRVLEWLKKHRIGVTLNFVIHRQNIEELEEMLVLVEEHQPGSVEL